ncbi:MAG: protein kinase [Proteobacteria bacterium]|jgi:WD40 repeat protein|nr:protein kinase [Pseudomonadota bacterium]
MSEFGDPNPAPEITAISAGQRAESPTVAMDDPTLAARANRPPVPAAISVTPECAGRYRLSDDDREKSEIGRGGFGCVLSVVDQHLGRTIAVKELHPDALFDESDARSSGYASAKVSRFLREARVTAQLIHPNIVPVYELGERDDGTLYYTMRLVRGSTLKEALRGAPTLGLRLRLLPHFVDVCQAIAFAHSHGVIHRDLKPDNVMLGEFGETLVLDWGLAKTIAEGAGPLEPRASTPPFPTGASSAELTGPSDLTVDGSFMGTPAYVSPEQAMGEVTAIDAKSDVWSLGAMLYEILTGRPPFVGRSAREVLIRVLTEEIRSAKELDPAVPSELASVCAKALTRDKSQRYACAKDLAFEVEAFRSGRRVHAHEYSAWEHLKRFAQAKKGLIAAVGAVFAVTIAALVFVAVSYGHEKDARQRAQMAAEREKTALAEEHRERLLSSFHFAEGAAEKAERLAGERRYAASRIYAAASLQRNPAFPKTPLFDAGFELAAKEANPLALRALSLAYRGSADAFLRYERTLVHGGPLNRVAFSPDGRSVAASAKDGAVEIWGVGDGRRVRKIQAHTGAAWAIAFSRDGKLLASAGADGVVRLFDATGGGKVAELAGHAGDVYDVAFATGDVLFSCGHDGTVRSWDVSGRRQLLELRGHDGPVHGVAVSEDGALVASGGRDRTVRIWRASGQGEPRVLAGHASVIRGVAFSRDGTMLASASYDKTARVWDVATGVERFVAGGHADEVLAAAFSDDGARLFTASWDREVRIFDLPSQSLAAAAEGFTGAVWSAAVSADGERVAAASEDGTVRIWRVVEPPPVLFVPGQGYLWSALFSPSGAEIATSGADGAVRLWNAKTGRLVRTLEGFRDLVAQIAFTPDGKGLVAGGYDGMIRIFDTTTGASTPIAGHEGFVRTVDVHPNGARFASGGNDGAVRIWSLPDGAPVRSIAAHDGAVRRVRFSPDGERLATVGGDGWLRVHDPATGALVSSFEVGGHPVTGVDFSPDGERLAVCAFDGSLLLFDDASKLARPRRLTRGAAGLYLVRFSPDGTRVVVSGDDSVVAVWSVEKGKLEFVFASTQSAVAVDFAPMGDAIVFGDSDRARVYDLGLALGQRDPQALLAAAQRDGGMTLDGFTLVPATPGAAE